MDKISKNREVDKYIENINLWKNEIIKLREILLDSSDELIEELKWGKASYTYKNKIITIIFGFKKYCGLIIPNGYFLKDKNKILVSTSEDALYTRQIRFKSMIDILNNEEILKEYILEAIEVERLGLRKLNKLKEKIEISLPRELEIKMKEDTKLNDAFFKLTPGRRRAYIIYFKSAKKTDTINNRIEKYKQKILEGKGLAD